MVPYKVKIYLYYLLIAFGLILLSSCEKKRTPTAYELPAGFTGWVTVKYEKPSAPPLEEVNGYYIIKISDSGFAETSSKIEDGWAQDKYYWLEDDKENVLPQYTEDKTSMIHAEMYRDADYRNFVNPDTLQIGKEYILNDDSKLMKLDNNGGVSYESGRPLLFTFYVSKKPENVWDFPTTKLPAIPLEHKVW
jgi:hypothetical protein